MHCPQDYTTVRMLQPLIKNILKVNDDRVVNDSHRLWRAVFVSDGKVVILSTATFPNGTVLITPPACTIATHQYVKEFIL